MKTAQWDTGYFDSSSDKTNPDMRDCDLMLRRSGSLYTPSIFCNPNLPKILACVARERALNPRTEASPGLLSTSKDLSPSGGLQDWYRSVLDDVYPDQVQVHSVDSDVRFESTGFCLTALSSFEVPSSGYQYVSLVLPPLWQAYSHLSDIDACCESPVRPIPMSVPFIKVGRKVNRTVTLCVFRMEKSTGLWYSRILHQSYRKIPRKDVSPEDS
jgi:hypothetical protein